MKKTSEKPGLVAGPKTAGEKRVEEVAKRIAERPELADLAPQALEALAKIVVAEELKDDLKRKANLKRISYESERKKFLEAASRTGSSHTQEAYRRALFSLEVWCSERGLRPLELSPALADDWIMSLRAAGRASATVSLLVSGASALWTWLERRHSELRNPFRGTKARPARKAKRAIAVPNEEEVGRIIAEAPGTLRAAVVVLAETGLRVGALPSLSVNADRYVATSKGKEISGAMTVGARAAVKKAGLSMRSPFAQQTARSIADAFRYLTKKLVEGGAIAARYSVHDLRHFYSARLYRATQDIYAVSRALSHASVSVTERYLASIGEGSREKEQVVQAPPSLPAVPLPASRRGRKKGGIVESYLGKSREALRRVMRELDVDLERIRGWLETEEDEATRSGLTQRMSDLEDELRKLEEMARY